MIGYTHLVSTTPAVDRDLEREAHHHQGRGRSLLGCHSNRTHGADHCLTLAPANWVSRTHYRGDKITIIISTATGC